MLAKMQIAVAVAHLAGAPALLEQVPPPCQLVAATRGQAGASLGPEDRLGQRREILGVALDHLAHSGVAAVFGAHGRLRVERRDLLPPGRPRSRA